MPRPLPILVRTLLRFVARLVPRGVRAAWLAEWRGELHYLRSRSGPAGTGADLRTLRHSLGCVPDAVWLRAHDWSPDMLLQDLRFAIRTLLDRPGFTLVAVATLAIGIGTNAALFSVVSGILLEPLPYTEPDRLVRLYGTNSERGLSASNVNPNDLLDIRSRATLLEGLSYYGGFSATLTVDGEPLRLFGGSVHSSFFEVLGERPHLGRFFSEEENVDGNHTVVVLSFETWRSVFGGDPDVVGRRLSFDEPRTVIGVAPEGFQDPLGTPQMWSPWARDPDNRGGHFMRAIGRMKPGVDIGQLQQELDVVYGAIAEEHGKPQRGVRAVGLHEAIVHDIRPIVLLLFGAVGFLLLVVCANVASLMLARSMSRRREVTVRMALGAGRGRLVRQLLTESLLLAAVGGAIGLLFAKLLLGLAATAAGDALPGLFIVDVDGRVLAFSLLITLGAGILFGLAPALHGTRTELAEGLRDRDEQSVDRARFRSALVVAEVALCLVLLVGAGLMLRSLGNLMNVDTGFDATDVLAFRLSVPSSTYPDVEQIPTFYERYMESLASLPGVQAVGATNRLPFSGSRSCDWFMLENWPMPEPGGGECAEERVIAGDYFGALGIEVVAGRPLLPTDGDDDQPVILVSQTMAERFMPGEDPLGRGFTWGPISEDTVFRRVVGVVRDIKHADLTADPMTEVYMPHEQYPYYRTMFVVVRSADPMALVPAVRDALKRQDPSIPVYQVASLEQLVSESVAPMRMSARVLAAFAGLALLLACVGLYGVLAYTVSQRTHELGVRMALGARNNDVVAMVFRQAMVMVLIGVVVGLAAARALSGGLSSLLFEIRPGDPGTYAGVAVTLIVVAAFAALLPARRATRVDPVRALRDR